MNNAEIITVDLRRFDPSSGEAPYYQRFEIPAQPNMRVLDVIRAIYETKCADLSFQYACRIGRCGTCSVKVNGVPVLACQERAKPRMRIEPLSPFPVVRDLVIDRGEVESRYVDLNLVPARGSPRGEDIERITPVAAEQICNLDRCISCMICVSACPAVEERAFDGPAFMLKLRQLSLHPANGQDRVEQAMEGGLMECFGCDACTQLCPTDLSPAQAIRELRRVKVFGGSQ